MHEVYYVTYNTVLTASFVLYVPDCCDVFEPCLSTSCALYKHL